MINEVNKSKWNEFHQKFLSWLNKRRNDQFTKVDPAYEHSISILQKRYGYTREEAKSQLNGHYSGTWLG